jgi:hypothetical protein
MIQSGWWDKITLQATRVLACKMSSSTSLLLLIMLKSTLKMSSVILVIVVLFYDFRHRKKKLENLHMTWMIECSDIHYTAFHGSIYTSVNSSSKVWC